MSKDKPTSLSEVRDAINNLRQLAKNNTEPDRREALAAWLTDESELALLLARFRQLDRLEPFATTSDYERIQFADKMSQLVTRLKTEYPDAEE